MFFKHFETPKGKALLAALLEPAAMAEIKLHSDEGRAAVDGGLGTKLLKLLGQWARLRRSKQMAGHMVRQILEAGGYKHVARGKKTVCKDLFDQGSRYRRGN